MKAVIMAGGEGKRLRPLTCTTPKPLLPVLGKPLMKYTVELLHRHHIYDIAATVAYKADQVKRTIGQSLVYFEEEEPLGTAGSVKAARAFLDRTFLVISGDALTDLDIDRAMDFHKRRNALATMVLKSVPNPLEYGGVVMGKDGRIQHFVEKPTWRQVVSDCVNTGMYILEPEIFSYIPDGVYDFGKQLFPMLAQKKERLYGYISADYWCDIGDIDTYLRAQQDVLMGRVKVAMPRLAMHNHVEEGAIIEAPCYIGEGAIIKRGAIVGRGSVIGNHAYIGPFASVRESVLLNGACICAHAQLRKCILGENATVCEHAEVYDGSVIAERACVNADTIVTQRCSVWPRLKTAQGETITQSVKNGASVSINFCANEASIGLQADKALRLGSALFAMDGPKMLFVCEDGSASAHFFADAFCAGAAVTGLEVTRAHSMGIAPFLFVSHTKEGIAAYFSYRDGITAVSFYSSGVPLSDSAMRKLKQAFEMGDAETVADEAVRPIRWINSGQSVYEAWRKECCAGEKTPLYTRLRNDQLAELEMQDGTLVGRETQDALRERIAQAYGRELEPSVLTELMRKDGYLFLSLLGRYLHDRGMDFDTLVKSCGNQTTLREVHCPNALKGSAMRAILEETQGNFTINEGAHIEQSGVKIHIQPEDNRESLRIFMQSVNEEYANELIKKYEEIVQSLQKKSGGM